MSLAMGAACPHCVAGRARPFGRIVRLGAFDDPLRQLVYDLKYRGAWRLADELARRLCESAVAGELLHRTEVFVAVPLHPRRHIARGYNQAELVARRLARLLGKRHARALVRVRDTASQAGLSAMADRQNNVRGAFALAGARGIKGRRVVLVDDVMTSGATLRSAAGALARAEPAELSAAVLAVADPRHRGFEAI
jgi:ComF family protein